MRYEIICFVSGIGHLLLHSFDTKARVRSCDDDCLVPEIGRQEDWRAVEELIANEAG